MLSKADIIEALLFASEKPVPLEKLGQIAELKPGEVLEEINILREEKARIGALQLVEVSGGWQLVTKPEYAQYVRQLRDVPRQKLSRAAFEVLSVVAYRQPVTRAEIESLRGVDCAGPLGFLLEKKLVNFAGRRETPGRPWLYATTPQFLDNFGLRSLDDLPSLSELAELSDSGPRELFARGPMTFSESDAVADEAESLAHGLEPDDTAANEIEANEIENNDTETDGVESNDVAAGGIATLEEVAQQAERVQALVEAGSHVDAADNSEGGSQAG